MEWKEIATPKFTDLQYIQTKPPGDETVNEPMQDEQRPKLCHKACVTIDIMAIHLCHQFTCVSSLAFLTQLEIKL